MTDINLEGGNIVIASPKEMVEGRKLSTILLRRRWQILSVYCVVMSFTSLLAFMTKPTYQSSMQILISTNLNEGVRSNPMGEGIESNLTNTHSLEVVDYTSLTQILLSSKLIDKAVNLLRSEYPEITVEDIRGKKGQQELTVTKVEGNVEDNKLLTQVFEVSFRDIDPVRAQKVLLAIQKVYKDYQIEQQKERLFRGLSFLKERLPKVNQEMVQAEKKLEQFQKKHNLLDPQVQGKILLESLADVEKQLRITRAQRQDVQARYNNLKKELDSSPQNAVQASHFSQSPQYQTLVNEIQKTELALNQERLRYTDNSPVVQKLIEQRQNQVTLLQNEIDRLSSSSSPLGKPETRADTLLKQKQLSTQESVIPQEQMVGIDLKLSEELVQVQTAALGLRAHEKSLTESEEQIHLELNRYPSLIAEYNRLLPEVETHRKTLEQLMIAQQSLGLMEARQGLRVQVLEEPQQGSPNGSSRFFITLLGALLGPILGVAAALLSETLSDAISFPQDLQRLTNLRLLGTVPKLPLLSPKQKVFSVRSIVRKIFTGSTSSTKTILQEHHPGVYFMLPNHETLDMVYQNIQLGSTSPCKSLMLTSAIPQEGKSTLALGLAVSAAHMHKRVLLIDANLREPNLHTILALPNDWGLSLLLVEETNTSVKEYIQPIHPSIDVLTAGPTPEDSVKLLSSGRMKELIEFFEQNYDIVLIDAPAILGTVNTRMIATYCNGIVMVGRLGQVTALELTEATGILSNLNLIGIIANEAPKNS